MSAHAKANVMFVLQEFEEMKAGIKSLTRFHEFRKEGLAEVSPASCCVQAAGLKKRADKCVS